LQAFGKVETILKGSLDSIPSPSVKIQIMGGKVCLRCKGDKKFVDITQQHFALLHQVKFPELSLKGKVVGSNPGYLLKLKASNLLFFQGR
jgi:hypothetical protein